MAPQAERLRRHFFCAVPEGATWQPFEMQRRPPIGAMGWASHAPLVEACALWTGLDASEPTSWPRILMLHRTQNHPITIHTDGIRMAE